MRTFVLVLLGTVLGVVSIGFLIAGFIEFSQLADAGNFPRAVAYLLTVLLAAGLGFECKVFSAWIGRFAGSGTKP